MAKNVNSTAKENEICERNECMNATEEWAMGGQRMSNNLLRKIEKNEKWEKRVTEREILREEKESVVKLAFNRMEVLIDSELF